jgi:hypothetical protein
VLARGPSADAAGSAGWHSVRPGEAAWSRRSLASTSADASGGHRRCPARSEDAAPCQRSLPERSADALRCHRRRECPFAVPLRSREGHTVASRDASGHHRWRTGASRGVPEADGRSGEQLRFPRRVGDVEQAEQLCPIGLGLGEIGFLDRRLALHLGPGSLSRTAMGISGRRVASIVETSAGRDGSERRRPSGRRGTLAHGAPDIARSASRKKNAKPWEILSARRNASSYLISAWCSAPCVARLRARRAHQHEPHHHWGRWQAGESPPKDGHRRPRGSL